MDAIAAATGLTFQYPGNSPALTGIDLELKQGWVLGLLGANGSGKSTLLKAFAGHLPGIAQSVRFHRGHKQTRISYIPQHADLDPEMTPKETLDLFVALHGAQPSRADSLISTFGISPFLEKPLQACSGGQRQRVHLALGFLPEADLLLADEPSTALDLESKEVMWRLLKERATTGCSVLVALHDLREPETQCDSLSILSEGRWVAGGTASELIQLHGRWSWKGTLAKPVQAPEAWQQATQSYPGNIHWSIDGNDVSLDAESELPADSELVRLAVDHGNSFTAYERRLPDLHSVLRRLSPGTPSASAAAQRGNGKGRHASGRRLRGNRPHSS